MAAGATFASSKVLLIYAKMYVYANKFSQLLDPARALPYTSLTACAWIAGLLVYTVSRGMMLLNLPVRPVSTAPTPPSKYPSLQRTFLTIV